MNLWIYAWIYESMSFMNVFMNFYEFMNLNLWIWIYEFMNMNLWMNLWISYQFHEFRMAVTISYGFCCIYCNFIHLYIPAQSNLYNAALCCQISWLHFHSYLSPHNINTLIVPCLEWTDNTLYTVHPKLATGHCRSMSILLYHPKRVRLWVMKATLWVYSGQFYFNSLIWYMNFKQSSLTPK